MSAERIEATVARMLTALRERGAFVSGDGRCHEDAAAWLLGVVPGTMANWRTSGRGPDFYRAARVTYRLHDLAAWLERRRIAAEIDSSDLIAHHGASRGGIDD